MDRSFMLLYALINMSGYQINWKNDGLLNCFIPSYNIIIKIYIIVVEYLKVFLESVKNGGEFCNLPIIMSQTCSMDERSRDLDDKGNRLMFCSKWSKIIGYMWSCIYCCKSRLRWVLR